VKSQAIDRLVDDVRESIAGASRGAALAQALTQYCTTGADWREFALFDDAAYARNLVHRDELFEMIVLCWKSGQASPIHNHQGQRCWMTVLDGEIEETIYRLPEAGKRGLITGPRKIFERGSVAYITDDVGLHRIAPVGSAPAISLHVYSRPIASCQIYDPESGEVAQRQLAYHSIRGVRQASAEQARAR